MFTSPRNKFFPWKKTKDTVLAQEIQEIMNNDQRFDISALSIKVDGGVAKVEGNVDSEEKLTFLRRVLLQHEGIYAVWDTISIKKSKPVIVDIGCGDTKQIQEAIGVDIFPGNMVDVVADLEKPLPFVDDSIDIVFAVHILEHIHHLVDLMNELHRVLKPQGLLHVITPYWQNVIAVGDPTHVRLMDSSTLRTFCEEKKGILPWKPQKIAMSKDSIFATLQPLKNSKVMNEDIARWFY